MLCPKPPTNIWAPIRSFSGDTGYEPTPTANLIKRDVLVQDGIAGKWLFPFGRDGYASTVVLALNPAYFVDKRDWLSYSNYSPKTFIRIIHLDYDGAGGYPIRATSSIR